LAGVRQGGVLSPIFYSLYVDDLISELVHSGVGCYMDEIFLSCFLYADDMAIVAPSMRALQNLLNICAKYCLDWDVKLNPKKSKLMFFGKVDCHLAPVTLQGVTLEFVGMWSYLGINVCSGRSFSCSVTEKIRKYYKCVNAILRTGNCSEPVLLRLIEAHAVPILTYGIEIIYISDPNEKRQLRVAYNTAFRRIVSIRPFDSVSELQQLLGRKTWEQIVEKRQSSFKLSLHKSNNAVIRTFC
jgi:hypothetical protein